jgi:hypothetical protein
VVTGGHEGREGHEEHEDSRRKRFMTPITVNGRRMP